MSKFYCSLDDAREELARRWLDEKLKANIEAELGQHFMPHFKNNPRGVFDPCLVSPGNGYTFFLQCSHYVKCIPIVTEYLADTFISYNSDKAGLGRLRAYLQDGQKVLVDLIDFGANERKMITDILIYTGERLVDFHHELLNISKYRCEIQDISDWFKSIGKCKDYYYQYLLHFIAHGVIFENFVTEEDEESDRETAFTQNVVLPAVARIEQRYGLKPLNVRLYPSRQSDEEDFYWWYYPPHVNEYIIEYAERHKLPIRKWHKRRKR